MSDKSDIAAGADDAPPLAGIVLPPRRKNPLNTRLMTGIARQEIERALADLGLDDAAARDDLADLRAALAGGRRLRFGLVQAIIGWLVQGVMLLAALGILLLAGGLA